MPQQNSLDVIVETAVFFSRLFFQPFKKLWWNVDAYPSVSHNFTYVKTIFKNNYQTLIITLIKAKFPFLF